LDLQTRYDVDVALSTHEEELSRIALLKTG
jgi:hypothetical protein